MRMPDFRMPDMATLQAAAGAVVAVIALVLGLVFGLGDGSSQPGQAQPPASQPANPQTPTVKTAYLADQPTSRKSNVNMDDYTAVAKGVSYPKSITARYSTNASSIVFFEPLGRWKSLDAKVAYDANVDAWDRLSPNSKPTGRVSIIVDDNVVKRVVVQPGQVEDLHVDLSNMRESLVIEFDGNYDGGSYFSTSQIPVGLSLLTPELSR